MHRAIRQAIAGTFMAALAVGAGAATQSPRLTADCEEALALSALPTRLRDDASVYTLTDEGFSLTRSAKGPFTCIVERNHADAVIPQCVDAAGADTIIPGIIAKTDWSLMGVPAAERGARFRALANRGDLRAPARSGISWMMSNFNYSWNARSGRLMRIPPHVRFYAPNLSNDDIGGSMAEGMGGNRGVPFIIEEGIHGYITTMVEKPSDSTDVRTACAGQLPDEPPTLGESRAAER